MRIYILTGVFLIFYCAIVAQNKRDYIWPGGYDPSPSETDVGFRFDFNVRPFEVIEANNGYRFGYNIASICDEEGELLFYSNGCAIINAEAQMMPNGDSINFNEWYEIFTDGECQYGYPGGQDIMILPDPGYDKGYYMFHKPRVYFPTTKDSTQLMMSYVDMTLDEGRGDVVYKNQPYYDGFDPLYCYFTAISHENGKDWWIVQPTRDSNIYLTFIVDEKGITKTDEQSIGKVFDWNASASGTAKFSPDGAKYAYYNESDGLLIFDFDRGNGKLSNYERVVPFDTSGYGIFCSVEWSANSRFIYTATMNKLHQIDTWEEDLQDGVRLIDVYNGTMDPFPTNFYLMAQGPDCRIYMRPTNGSNSYHVINHPDSLGIACNFVQNGIKLPVPSGGGLPNFPRFRVDEEEKCDPTIVSVFGEKVWYRRDLKVWPNPSSGVFNVELPEKGKGKLVVFDMQGAVVCEYGETQCIASPPHGNSVLRIDLTHLPMGRYNVEFWPERDMGLKAQPSNSGNSDRVYYSAQVVKVE